MYLPDCYLIRFPTLSNYYLNDWWCNVNFCLFIGWFDSRFCCRNLTREIGGPELASTITFVLQANWLTKCACHPKMFLKGSAKNQTKTEGSNVVRKFVFKNAYKTKAFTYHEIIDRKPHHPETKSDILNFYRNTTTDCCQIIKNVVVAFIRTYW